MELRPFESPKLLLDGAKESIEHFESLHPAFADDARCVVTRRFDAETQEHVFGYRCISHIPGPMRLAAYRAVNDLRSSLDQATCDAGLVLGAADVRHVHFPMGRDPEDFRNEIKRRCRGLDAELVEHISAHKAYLGGNTDLWALGRMAGPNKHQRVLAVGVGGNGVTLHPGMVFGGGAFRPNGVWNAARQEVELFRGGADAQFADHYTPSVQVVIGATDTLSGKPAIATLYHLLDVATAVVFGLEAEAKRILVSREAG